MMIDWFTVVAQVINFLILVWLLKRFLYKPILDAIDAREHRIANALAAADDKERDAQQQFDELERKNRELADNRATLIGHMKDEVNMKRQKLLDDAHQAADVISAKRKEALQHEQKSFGDEIVRRTQDQVFSISRKALQDLADTSLEERIIRVFIGRLHELRGDAKHELGKSLIGSTEPVRVRSAYALSIELQASIRQSLNETFSDEIAVRFETAPDTIGGIELISNGRKVAWSIAEYLQVLQKSIAELTNVEEKSQVRATEVESESLV